MRIKMKFKIGDKVRILNKSVQSTLSESLFRKGDIGIIKKFSNYNSLPVICIRNPNDPSCTNDYSFLYKDVRKINQYPFVD